MIGLSPLNNVPRGGHNQMQDEHLGDVKAKPEPRATAEKNGTMMSADQTTTSGDQSLHEAKSISEAATRLGMCPRAHTRHVHHSHVSCVQHDSADRNVVDCDQMMQTLGFMHVRRAGVHSLGVAICRWPQAGNGSSKRAANGSGSQESRHHSSREFTLGWGYCQEDYVSEKEGRGMMGSTGARAWVSHWPMSSALTQSVCHGKNKLYTVTF
jgi:hypothetical protein